ncbi:myb-like DNA-binding domain-containing protein [Colletotrichum paranaense]|uniref:Myb-like DNA-binding domain-containing protein n=4 Tax=Colletotrichum acutatum species complex TaxID=2707335 RepID=A0AAI9Y3I9_9PEZI|nr:myb-like DNA-binding domain-containing protein [Colletotrichum paranaense]KAK0368885.1 myb-like DNA-binding domain-containing protein [Colletotrichum limetticola]KAK1448005.1 myb-like DNA-binding domain-containing protein [Colletotrichum cuscutae]KAK1469482.1 myb-like DNA-binding domain-containing protein [Colletotrichum melonis]KAK1529374.1 myb-like DNA-binding domain-containing protein [Colletotrichum paranaense]
MSLASQRRGPWSQQEDAYLMQLVNDQGPLNWVRIAQALGTRTPKQCRERFHQNLKPTLNHEPITPEEGAQIEILVNEIGKRWAEIARRLHGRSDNAVKNWWNGSQNRRKRHDRRRANQGSTSGYDDRRYGHSGFRPTLTINSHAASYPHTRHGMSSPVSPAFYTHSHPYYQFESPLPSPNSTSSPGTDGLDGETSTMSDAASSYTTSPQCLSRGTSPSVQLAPLRMDENSAPRSLPSFGSLINAPTDRKEAGHMRLPSLPSHLLTAPNSPVRSTVQQALPPPSPSSADKDSRMDVSALLG